MNKMKIQVYFDNNHIIKIDLAFFREKRFSQNNEELKAAIFILCSRVMRVGSDTFGDPIFQKGLQN